MEIKDCNMCKFSLLGIVGFDGGPVDEPVLKCMRYPATIVVIQEEDGWHFGQINPEASQICGEFRSAEITSSVIGTLRKDKTWNRTLYSGSLLLSRWLWLRHVSRK